MIHLSSYHSNGMPAVVWSNRVNLIGEKVYKPKIHFCENCNKPILIYGRLIPCKHVFCFTCATLCLNQQSCNTNNNLIPTTATSPPLPAQNDVPQSLIQSPHNNSNSSWNNNNNNNGSGGSNNKNTNHLNDKHQQHRHSRSSNNKNQAMYRSDSNHSLAHKDNNNCLMNIEESISNTTPTTIHQDTINSPNASGSSNVTTTGQQNHSLASKGCHRCGGRALRVERNVLNSIFVCHVDSCKRTYLSARDLQAHVTHRHSRHKSNNGNPSTSSASMVAISSSPYISSSSLLHLYNGQSNRQSSSNNSIYNNAGSSNNITHNNHTNSTTTTNTISSNNTSNTTNTTLLNNNNNNTSTINNNSSKSSIRSPTNSHQQNNRRDRDSHHHHGISGRDRNRARDKDRERYNKDREGYHRERSTKEHHKQSLQRAAQWAEASAQMLEKGLTR